MNERLKLIRKVLKLSQEEFGKRLGVLKSAISKLEKGENNLTEQMIKLICREFKVDYMWLTTGKGDMFTSLDDDYSNIIDDIMEGESDFHKNIFKTFARLDTEDLLALERILDKYIEVKEEAKK